MDLGLKDNVAVITGASVCIGLAVAEHLAADGAHIVMAGSTYFVDGGMLKTVM
jgi:3-oxoacyl-[acyl-carrier protein] reductase